MEFYAVFFSNFWNPSLTSGRAMPQTAYSTVYNHSLVPDCLARFTLICVATDIVRFTRTV